MRRRGFLASLVVIMPAMRWTPRWMQEGWSHYYKTVELKRDWTVQNLFDAAKAFPKSVLGHLPMYEFRPLKQLMEPDYATIFDVGYKKYVRCQVRGRTVRLDFYSRPLNWKKDDQSRQ